MPAAKEETSKFPNGKSPSPPAEKRAASANDSKSSRSEKRAASANDSKSSRRHSSTQCDLQVVSDAESSSGASITAESVSSTNYRRRVRPKTAPNHFRTQTAPSRLQRPRKPTQKPNKGRQKADKISDVSSETSSLEPVYRSHITCQVSHDAPGFYEYHRPISVYRKPLWRPLSLPNAFEDSPKLNHPDLNPGQREYLWHTASVYSVGNLKSLAQRRYRQVLYHQIETGFHTREECERYFRYIDGTRKRQYETDTSVWRAPPKLPVKPKHFPKRYRSPEEVDEARRVQTGYYRGRRSKSSEHALGKEGITGEFERIHEELESILQHGSQENAS